jgi:hypothetical protein
MAGTVKPEQTPSNVPVPADQAWTCTKCGALVNGN